MSAEKPREIAVRVLRRHADGAGWIEELLDAALAAATLSPADRALARELTFGVVRWQDALDWIIRRKTAGREQKLVLQILLRLGLYQLFWLDRIPDHAAVHESVQLARELGCGPQAGFINAVLRGCLRERDVLRRELMDLKEREPHLGFSHPRWLCERWEKRWGSGKLRALLEWNSTPPPVFIRVNTLKTNAGTLAAQFEQEGVLFTPRSFDWAPETTVLELRSHPALPALPSFQRGWFYAQDPSTLLAVRELDPQPGETILDLCAAPGGKTTCAAQLMNDRGTIVAHDVDAGRRELIRQNCERLGVACVQIVTPTDLEGRAGERRFDRVLVDAPCSNTGVLRRRVDLRRRLQPSEILRLRGTQLNLLRQAAALLKPGGTLVYSTCSLEPEENHDVVAEFLECGQRFRRLRERELIPFLDGTDGAYVAVLQAEGSSPG